MQLRIVWSLVRPYLLPGYLPPPTESRPNAVSSSKPNGDAAFDLIVRSIWNGAGDTVDQLAGHEADLTQKDYGCRDNPDWVVFQHNGEAEERLQRTITDITVYRNESCRSEEVVDCKYISDDGTAYAEYIC